jgi:hypothetical protein
MASSTWVELLWTMARPCGELRQSAGSCEATARPSQYFGPLRATEPVLRPFARNGLEEGTTLGAAPREPQLVDDQEAGFFGALDVVPAHLGPDELFDQVQPDRPQLFAPRAFDVARQPRGQTLHQVRVDRGQVPVSLPQDLKQIGHEWRTFGSVVARIAGARQALD